MQVETYHSQYRYSAIQATVSLIKYILCAGL